MMVLLSVDTWAGLKDVLKAASTVNWWVDRWVGQSALWMALRSETPRVCQLAVWWDSQKVGRWAAKKAQRWVDSRVESSERQVVANWVAEKARHWVA